MTRKIGLHIGGRRFDVDVDGEFAKYLMHEMADDFNIEGNNDLKLLLQAYVKKNYEVYMQEKKIEEITKKMDSL